MKLLNTAIIRLTLVLMLGIGVGSSFSLALPLLFYSLGGSLLFFLFAFLRSRKLLLQDSLFGLSCLLLFFLLGISTAHLQHPQNQPRHFSKLVSEKTPVVIAQVREELKPGSFQDRYIVEVKKFDSITTFGKLLLLLPRECKNLEVDELVLISSKLEPIPVPLNPQQFNYRKFMENRKILFQVSPTEVSVLKPGPGKSSLYGAAAKTRTTIVNNLKRHQLQEEELAIIQALLLGQRQDISSETYENYAAAGVIHILAISGLHIGIILWILHLLFSPLNRFKKGRTLKMLILIFLLWTYAFLAGLSPSVVRAVTMFSFLAIGMQLKRQHSVLNSLFLSLLFLLLIKPQLLFEVGFQLSYLAVFSIVILRPTLFHLLPVSNSLIKYFWGLFSVTLAAQIGVLPLSLYYFHQFPGLFLISNLVLLPFLGIFLALGLLVILLSLLNMLPAFLSDTYSFLINSMNSFVTWVAQQENFVLQEIGFSLPQLILSYGLLLALFLLLKVRTLRTLKVVLIAVILVQGTLLIESFSRNSSEFIIFHKSRQTVLAEKRNRHLLVSHDLPSAPEQERFLQNYMLERNMSITETAGLKNIYGFGKETLLLIDSTAVYPVQDLRAESILLTGSPELNLERLLRELCPKQVIADGSNYPSLVKLWKATCIKEKIPFHYTGEKGAFILTDSPIGRIRF